MRFLVAPDKFKGSLAAREVAENIAIGIRDVLPDAEIDIAAIADGGDGTSEVIRAACGGEWATCAAHDAIGRMIDARYLWMHDTATTFIDISEAAGLRRLQLHERDLLRASTFGVGEMIRDAARRGAREIVVGLGGSATNDGGFGLARALGYRFFAGECELTDRVDDLLQLERIVAPADLQLPKIVAAADVRNPLLGPRGATRIFGPQKGGNPAELDVLEEALPRLADVVTRILGCDLRDIAGAGAAGGLGFGLMSFCNAQLQPGFDVVAKAIRLEQKVRSADLVITGEGRLDAQTLEGKAPAGVAQLARKHGRNVYAIVGESSSDAAAAALFDSVFALARPPASRTLAIKLTTELLRERAAELTQTLRPRGR